MITVTRSTATIRACNVCGAATYVSGAREFTPREQVLFDVRYEVGPMASIQVMCPDCLEALIGAAQAALDAYRAEPVTFWAIRRERDGRVYQRTNRDGKKRFINDVVDACHFKSPEQAAQVMERRGLSSPEYRVEKLVW